MSKNINDLRDVMFEAMQSLRDGTITVEQAKAMSSIGDTIINSAKLEVEFAKATGHKGSGFIAERQPALPAGVTGITRHHLQG